MCIAAIRFCLHMNSKGNLQLKLVIGISILIADFFAQGCGGIGSVECSSHNLLPVDELCASKARNNYERAGACKTQRSHSSQAGSNFSPMP